MYPKIGDIVRNNMASRNKYFEKEKQWWSRNFIYMGVNGRFVRAICLNGKIEIENQAFYKNDLKNIDNNVNFDVVGHSKAFEMMKDELIKEYDEIFIDTDCISPDNIGNDIHEFLHGGDK